MDNVSCTFQFLLTIRVCSSQYCDFVPHLDEALAEVSALPLKASESVVKGRPGQYQDVHLSTYGENFRYRHMLHMDRFS